MVCCPRRIDIRENCPPVVKPRAILWRPSSSTGQDVCRRQVVPASHVERENEERTSTTYMTGDLSFTAAAIARAIGCSKQNIHQRLSSVPADREQLAGGNLAKAWRIESLPAGLARQLSEKAE